MSRIHIENVPQPGRRVKMIAVAPELIIEWWKGMKQPRTFSSSGLPDDARVVASHYDHDCGLIRLLVESATFPERQAGTMVEEMVVTFTEHFETVAVHR